MTETFEGKENFWNQLRFLVPWVPEIFSRVRRGALSVADRSRNRKPLAPRVDFWVTDHLPQLGIYARYKVAFTFLGSPELRT